MCSQALGVGYSYVGDALNERMTLEIMALLVVFKLIGSSVSYATGNTGGIFGPSLFIGAMLGGTVGGVAHHLLPAYTATPGAYALVGMGTAFAGIVRAPMTSVMMIFETTRDYTVIVPLMISNMVSFLSLPSYSPNQSISRWPFKTASIYLPQKAAIGDPAIRLIGR